jgi:hypothetical protein
MTETFREVPVEKLRYHLVEDRLKTFAERAKVFGKDAAKK